MPKSLVRFDLYSTNDVELPAGMFEGCAELDTIAMNRVTKIGSRAFAGCTALGSGDFRLPDVPPVLGDDVFAEITMQKGVLRTMSGTAASLQAYLNAGGQWQAWFGETPTPQPQPKPQSGSSTSSSTSQSGKWVLNDRGWWYDYGNSLWPSNQWSYLYYNGRSDWYYFDAEGYLVTGWYTDTEGRTYYLHPLADGRRGYMYTGWNQIDEVWYYFSTEAGASNGMLLKNTVTPDGYRVDENGAWVQ